MSSRDQPECSPVCDQLGISIMKGVPIVPFASGFNKGRENY